MDAHSRLGVKITATSTNCLPGHPVEVTVQVTDALGGPVPGAEVVLYAVDDGILGLTDYKLPDPHGFFYAVRPLSVQSSVSLPNLLPEDPDDLQFENKGHLGGGGGRTGCERTSWPAPSGMPRFRLMPMARSRVQFPAPDSLTRYRLLAVAHTGESHFGSSQSAFHVTKPLVIEPSLPSIANITDHLIARGVVLESDDQHGRSRRDARTRRQSQSERFRAGPEPAGFDCGERFGSRRVPGGIH